MSFVLLVVLAAAMDPSDRLVRDAQTLARETYPRATHVVLATPGRFGDDLVENLEGLQPFYRAHEALTPEMRDACREAANGLKPLPLACWELAVDARLSVQALLAGTHALQAGMPADLRALSSPQASSQAYGWLLLQHAARLATYTMAVQVETRKPELAVDTCVDVLALGRDVMHGTGLLGVAVGESIQAMALRPCARALDAAGPERKARALEQLKLIRTALPAFSAALFQEQVHTSLAAFGTLLEPGQRTALPMEARRLIESETVRHSRMERALLRASQLDYLDYMDALVASADLPSKRRTVLFTSARERIRKSLNPLTQAAAPDLEHMGRRMDRVRAVLDVLVEATRVDLERRQEWPLAKNPTQVTVTPLHGNYAKVAALCAGDDLFVTMSADRPNGPVTVPTRAASR